MNSYFKRGMAALVALSLAWSPIAWADTRSTIGSVGPVDSSMAVLDPATQTSLRSSGAIGANEVSAMALNNCGARMDAAKKDSAKSAVIASTPADPVKGFNDAIGSCLQNIQNLAALVKLPDLSALLNFDFSGLLDQMMKDMMEKVIMAVCDTATKSWNKAVNNAANTINNGVNLDGLNAFTQATGIPTTTIISIPITNPGGAVAVPGGGGGAVITPVTPPPPRRPVNGRSTIPGL